MSYTKTIRKLAATAAFMTATQFLLLEIHRRNVNSNRYAISIVLVIVYSINVNSNSQKTFIKKKGRDQHWKQTDSPLATTFFIHHITMHWQTFLAQDHWRYGTLLN